MYVYCDVVEPQMVGSNALGPLSKLGLPLVGSAVAPLLGDLAGGLVKKK